VDDASELEKAYREEAVRIRAALAARLGDVGLAEEFVQDAFIEALEHWRADGVPANPAGWLATTARRKAIDRIRRERTGQEKLALLAVTESPQAGLGGRPAEQCEPDPDVGQDEADELLGLVLPELPYFSYRAPISAIQASRSGPGSCWPASVIAPSIR
jgi:predicted RNA polymerase sigma factor